MTSKINLESEYMLENLSEAQVLMNDLYFRSKSEGETPESTLEELKSVFLIPSVPKAVSEFGEFVYARQDQFSKEVKSGAAKLIEFATSFSWWGFDVDSRGIKMVRILRGEAVTGSIPEPFEAFRIQPSVEETHLSPGPGLEE